MDTDTSTGRRDPGLMIAALSGRAVAGLLIGVAPTDPVSFAASALILGLVSSAASVLPARAALRIDPARVLTPD
jgi:ABC-type antimicrobial peptide transport system permease subunit